jgi:hypothetical protein
MSPGEIATAVRWRLASDIETELASHARVAERIAALHWRLASDPEDWVVAAAMLRLPSSPCVRRWCQRLPRVICASCSEVALGASMAELVVRLRSAS